MRITISLASDSRSEKVIYAYFLAYFAVMSILTSMSQSLVLHHQTGTRTVEMPNPDEHVIPNVVWGRPDVTFTPAFWYVRATYAEIENRFRQHRLGRTLIEEVCACLLGGYGMPAELGLAAFNRLVERELVSPGSSEEDIRKALIEPVIVGGRSLRYRYPNQKSKFLAASLMRFSDDSPPENDDLRLRNWLVEFPGIGYKTASWITRNYLASNQVAILDVHLIRAGVFAGLFGGNEKLPRDYLCMERRLVDFSRGLKVPLSILDAMIWSEMRVLGSARIVRSSR